MAPLSWDRGAVAGLLTIIPGLDTALVLRAAISNGRRHAFATAVGVNSGVLVWGACLRTEVAVGESADRDRQLIASGHGKSVAVLRWLAARSRP